VGVKFEGREEGARGRGQRGGRAGREGSIGMGGEERWIGENVQFMCNICQLESQVWTSTEAHTGQACPFNKKFNSQKHRGARRITAVKPSSQGIGYALGTFPTYQTTSSSYITIHPLVQIHS